MATKGGVQVLIGGPMLVYFNLIFGGTRVSHKVTIGQVTLRLEE